ncbi:response regulator receiver [Desulfurobacterium thermolithotrophum DSM 11699]|uniref:Response regulator receiver n=1 Tax=Desulfurobacterium thermolithotrophum (strain DSM 11699 / BSA) TaxID=868864 RepID=F0S2Z3_DESTD|nr:response regulator [Desulfurobacterium thermolithotrophum]ADY73215.1 response regulator receiver [Desulfurobacterium thermolithotrophum DSM 11699]
MKILYADDKKTWHILLEKVLKERGITVIHAYTLKEVLNKISQEKPDVIILDMTLQNGTALDVLSDAVKFGFPVLVIGYEQDGLNEEKLKSSGATEVLKKPFTVEELLSVLSEIKKKLPEFRKEEELEIVLPGEIIKASKLPLIEKEKEEEEEEEEEEIQIIPTDEMEVVPSVSEEIIELENEEDKISKHTQTEISKEEPLKEDVSASKSPNMDIDSERLKEILRPEIEKAIREIIWEVVPELAEKIIREEIEKLVRSRLV